MLTIEGPVDAGDPGRLTVREFVTRQLATAEEEERFLDHQAMLALEGKDRAPSAAHYLLVRAFEAKRATRDFVREGGISAPEIRRAVEARLGRVARANRMPGDVVKGQIAKLHLYRVSRSVAERRNAEVIAALTAAGKWPV